MAEEAQVALVSLPIQDCNPEVALADLTVRINREEHHKTPRILTTRTGAKVRLIDNRPIRPQLNRKRLFSGDPVKVKTEGQEDQDQEPDPEPEPNLRLALTVSQSHTARLRERA